MKTLLILFGKLMVKILKLLGKNAGNLPGCVLWTLTKHRCVSLFTVDCPIIAVTGTNGKTSVTNYVAQLFEKTGANIITNHSGNNLDTGICSLLLQNCDWRGNVKADYLILETDESHVPVVYSQLHLETLVVLNFFRDQLDRNGEVETLIMITSQTDWMFLGFGTSISAPSAMSPVLSPPAHVPMTSPFASNVPVMMHEILLFVQTWMKQLQNSIPHKEKNSSSPTIPLYSRLAPLYSGGLPIMEVLHMKPIKVLHMYADILDLYGDSGNMEILSYRCQMRQIPFVCDHYRLNDPVPNFSDYDLIYLGGGADMEQRMLSSDLLRCKDGLKKAYADGVFFLMICGGYQLMGKFYRDADGNELPGLGLFNYYTIAPHSRRKRCIGNIIIRTQLTGEPLEVVGFENHGGQTHDVSSPFGTVLYGNGNQFQCQEEGYCEKTVIATYLHGPLLSKNPKLSDYILKTCLERKMGTAVQLPPLDDTLEQTCHDHLCERLLKEKNA